MQSWAALPQLPSLYLQQSHIILTNVVKTGKPRGAHVRIQQYGLQDS